MNIPVRVTWFFWYVWVWAIWPPGFVVYLVAYGVIVARLS